MKKHKSFIRIFLSAPILSFALLACTTKTGPTIPLVYNVVWNTPSKDALESMPLSGRLGAGANVWVQDSSVWLYLAHNMANDEDGRLLKLGCLRITPKNGALTNLATFKQGLDINSGAITITSESKSGARFNAKLWFAGEQLIIETSSEKNDGLELSFGSWRDIQRDSVFLDMGNSPLTVRPDSIKMTDDGLYWFHRNANYPSILDDELKQQPIPKESICNPSENNVFGGAIVCDKPLTAGKVVPVHWQAWDGSAWTMTAEPALKHVIAVAVRAEVGDNPKSWVQKAKAFLESKTLEEARIDEANRWKEFWTRSYITINPEANESDSAWIVGRNYQLFRFMLACNRDGELPLRFNGGIFTTDNFPGRITGNNNDELKIDAAGPSTPDYRRWLFCQFMAQNQRWLGWPAILAGDADLLEPSTALYRIHRNSAAARAHVLGAEGVVYPEPVKVWGLSWNATNQGLSGAEHLNHAFAMMLENAWMTLHGHATLGTDIRADLPWIQGTVRFFDSFFRNETKRLSGKELGSDGKLSIYPANSIEYACDAKNPIETVAGLRRISDALLKLENDLLSDQDRAYFTKVLTLLPELPVGEFEGKPILKVAESFRKEYNTWELPELYAAWPYRLNCVTRPGSAEIAQNTWDLLPAHRAKNVKQDFSWMPVVVNMAAIGNTAEAARRIVAKLGNFNPQARFPAFFGPGHDWLPDHNWGGSGMVGLQEMLMAADPYGDGKIYLLPAWPTKWDVDFKLHAPQQTVVEVSVRKGKIVYLKVIPESRGKDVMVNPEFSLTK